MQRFDATQLKTRQLSHNRIVFADFLSDLTNGNANIARIKRMMWPLLIQHQANQRGCGRFTVCPSNPDPLSFRNLISQLGFSDNWHM